MVVEEQDYYYSGSDSDDEDVSRYVFLARQPAPAGRHSEEDDRNASFANDDDDGDDGDGTAGGEESKGGVWKRNKMPLLEILDDDAPPPNNKARLELIIAPPLAAQTPLSGSESNLASSPLAGESGSEGCHEKAHEHRATREQGEAKNATKKQRGACGKRSRRSGCDVDGDRDAHRHAVAAAAAAKTGASSGGRFPCSLCDRCFDSHQALGGHVLGHRKRAKIDIAAGAVLDVDDDKVHGNGNGGVGEPVFAGSHDDADGNGFDSKCSNSIAVSGHGFTEGNSRSDGKMDTGTASPNRKVVVAGTCHEGANGNGNGCRTRYKCKVCGTECLTGRALGGHMGKHRKRAPVGGGGEEDRSPSPATDDDRQTFGAAVRRRD